MSADPRRAGVDARVLDWIRSQDWSRDDARFEAVARELFAFQFAHCAPYRRFCEGRGRTPDTFGSWREIPPVPAGAFKELTLTSFPPERAVHVFRTSGTSTAARGALHLDTLALYEASLRPTFRRHVLPDLEAGARARIVVLTSSTAEQPDSSLGHMFAVAIADQGDAGSGFFVHEGELDVDGVALALATEDTPPCVCGTAFAFVHLVDALASRGERLALPPQARVMETGGFKGRSREVTRDDLHAQIALQLGVPCERIVNQYGMTELASQFYDSVLAQPGAPRRKLGPPWARVRFVDPETGADVPDGDVGAIVVVDLANTGSICAIQTADLGRRVGDGFEVLGREPGAEARGCSIAADELLGGAAS